MTEHRSARAKGWWRGLRPGLAVAAAMALTGCPVVDAISAWLGATGHLLGKLVPQCGCPSQLPMPPVGSPPPDGFARAYDPSPQGVVFTRVHATAPSDPESDHRDILVISGDGSWQAGRYFPSVQPPVVLDLASGSISGSRLQGLVEQAFVTSASGSRFVDLPSVSYDGNANRARRWITLDVTNGSHSVAVDTPDHPAFEALDQALEHATVDMGALGRKTLD